MSPYQALATAIRLFAICLAIYALRAIPAIVLASRGDVPGLGYASFIFALSLVLAISLWFFPVFVAGRILSRPIEPKAPATQDAWLAMGCALLGLYVVTFSIPDLLRDSVVIQLASGTEQVTTEKSWAISNAVETVIGAWLIFGANGFRKLFWWARQAGYQKPLP